LNSLGSGQRNLLVTFTDTEPNDTVEYVVFILDFSGNSIRATDSFSLEDDNASVINNNDGSATIVWNHIYDNISNDIVTGTKYYVQLGKNEDFGLVMSSQDTQNITQVIYSAPTYPSVAVDHSGNKLTLNWDKVSNNGADVTSYNIYKTELNSSRLMLDGNYKLSDFSGNNIKVAYNPSESDLYVKSKSNGYVKSHFGNLKKITTIDYIKNSFTVGNLIIVTPDGLTDLLGNQILDIDGLLYDSDGIQILGFDGNEISIKDDKNYVISKDGNLVLSGNDGLSDEIRYPNGSHVLKLYVENDIDDNGTSVVADTNNPGTYINTSREPGYFVEQKYGIYNKIENVSYVQANKILYNNIIGSSSNPLNLLYVMDNNNGIVSNDGIVSKLGKLFDLSGNMVHDLSGNSVDAVNMSVKCDASGQPLLTLLDNCQLIGTSYSNLIKNYNGEINKFGYQINKNTTDIDTGFLVTATNLAGESPAIGSVEMPFIDNLVEKLGNIVNASPDAPTSLVATTNSDTSGFTLTWNVPSSNGQYIGGYLLTVNDFSGNSVYGTVAFSDLMSNNSALVSSLNKPADTVVSLPIAFNPQSIENSFDKSLAGYFINNPKLITGSNGTNGLSFNVIKSINFATIKNYQFRLVAVNQNINKNTEWATYMASRNMSAFSNYASIMPKKKPLNVNSVTSEAGNGNATLTIVDNDQNADTLPILSYLITYMHNKKSQIQQVGEKITKITGLTNGVEYTFTVMARNAKGLGLGESSVKVTPYGLASPPVVYLDGHGDKIIRLAWNRPVNDGGVSITGYNVYRSDDGQSWALLNTPLLQNTVYSYEDTDNTTPVLFTSGKRYYYYITAVNSVGESSKSNIVSDYPSNYPGVPYLNITIKNQQVTLNMTPPTNDNGTINNGGDPLSSYTVYRGVAGHIDPVLGDYISENPEIDTNENPLRPYKLNVPLDGSGNAVFVDTDTVIGNVYLYKVVAVNRDGPGEFNNFQSTTITGDYKYFNKNDATIVYVVPYNVPAPITSLYVRSEYNNTEDKPSSIDLIWAPPNNYGAPVTSYQVQVSDNNEETWKTLLNFDSLTSTSNEITKITVSGGSSNIVTTDETGNFMTSGILTGGMTGGINNPWNTTNADTLSRGMLYNVDGSGYEVIPAYDTSGNSVVKDTSGYVRVRMQIDPSGSGINMNNVEPNYEMGSEYSYRLFSRNILGQSTASNTDSAVVSRISDKPTMTNLVAGNKSVTLNWEAPMSTGGSNLLSYWIYSDYSGNSVSGGPPNYTIFKSVPAGILTTTITQDMSGNLLENGITYNFKIQALNKNGFSSDSTSVNATPRTVPLKPENLTSISQNGSITVQWQPPLNASELSNLFEYEYMLKNLLGNVVSQNSLLSTAPRISTISGLTNGENYTFYVRATDINNNIYSDYAMLSVSPSAISYGVNPLSVSRSVNNISLIWDKPVNDGGSPIIQYLIVWYDKDSTNYKILESTTRTYVFQNVNMTHAAIFAVNSNGVSPMSNVVIV
jgi:hypothetical protein